MKKSMIFLFWLTIVLLWFSKCTQKTNLQKGEFLEIPYNYKNKVVITKDKVINIHFSSEDTLATISVIVLDSIPKQKIITFD